MPASALSWVSAITGELAGPEVPKLILLGFALASAISSAKVLYGSLASMISTSGGPSVTLPISGEIGDRVVGHRDVVQVLHVGERIDQEV